jgi:ABC-type antimicrobial peptide transport system permease subunit
LLVGLFGALSLGLAAIGVFGVFVCVVVDRVREFAIRSALGASRRNILGLLMRQRHWGWPQPASSWAHWSRSASARS